MTWEPLVFAKARSMARGVVSKFQPCLPAEQEDRLLAEKFLDLAGTLRFVVQMQYAAREGGVGLRLGDGAVDVLPELSPEVVLPPVAGAFQPRNPISWVDSAAGLARLAELLAAETVIALAGAEAAPRQGRADIQLDAAAAVAGAARLRRGRCRGAPGFITDLAK